MRVEAEATGPALGQRGQYLAVVFPDHDDLLGGVLMVRDGGAQPDHAQVPVPVAGQVADAGPHVRQRGLRAAQRAVLPDQPGERLLRDVLGIVGAEQGGQPHHLRVPSPE